MSTHEIGPDEIGPYEIGDDVLLLYYYRDGLEAAERQRIAAALIAEPELACRLQALVAQLDAAAAVPEVPVPLQTQRRWHAALERAAAMETMSVPRSTRLKQWRRPALAAAAAAALAIAFLFATPSTTERGATLLTRNEPSRCECGVRWHLASVERQLAGLSATRGEERAALIDTVIAQNRIYAIAAERSGDQRLAGALRAFTPILESLAHSDAANGDSAAELSQLNFELRVMQARLTAGATHPSAPSVAL